jgi:hypothetical protein
VRRLALAAAAAALLVLAGCGSGGERLTQAQFDAKVRAVCAGYTKRAERELRRLTPPKANPASPTATPLDTARFARLIEHVATLFGKQLEDLRQLRPPADYAGRYTEALAVYRRIEDALVRTARTARRGDRRGLEALELELTELGRQADAFHLPCA